MPRGSGAQTGASPNVRRSPSKSSTEDAKFLALPASPVKNFVLFF
jgi:hypothetical protein